MVGGSKDHSLGWSEDVEKEQSKAMPLACVLELARAVLAPRRKPTLFLAEGTALTLSLSVIPVACRTRPRALGLVLERAAFFKDVTSRTGALLASAKRDACVRHLEAA